MRKLVSVQNKHIKSGKEEQSIHPDHNSKKHPGKTLVYSSCIDVGAGLPCADLIGYCLVARVYE